LAFLSKIRDIISAYVNMYVMFVILLVWSANWNGFSRPGLTMGVENDIFWPETGLGFGNTPPPKIPIPLGKEKKK